jgi:dTDP-4-amino-4,6-dideoxygalactose transaminase
VAPLRPACRSCYDSVLTPARSGTSDRHYRRIHDVTDRPSVPLLDLKAQYAALRDEIDTAIREVLDSHIFVLGPVVQRLEQLLAAECRVAHGIGCASGSDALLLALMALDVGPGDEVICPSFTFFATAGSIACLGARPVFADIDPVTYNIDVDHACELAEGCTRLKAIMPVHLYGQVADMDALLGLAATLDVPVIEDAAQAIGARDARGLPAGSRGAMGCFSFYPTKNLGGFGDGGMMTTGDDALAARLRMLRVHGSPQRYHHDIVGINSRLDAIQAAVLVVKHGRLAEWNEARRRHAAAYDRAFGAAGAVTTAAAGRDADLPIRTPHPPAEPARHVHHQYVIQVPAAIRDDLREHLRERGIGSEVYYPIPLHEQACFAEMGYRPGDLPVSEAAARSTIALPIYPELTGDQVATVVEQIVQYVRSHATAPTGRA